MIVFLCGISDISAFNNNLYLKMWQIVKDVKNGKMEANLFVDQWPDFNTVISQEFIPRLSEVDLS